MKDIRPNTLIIIKNSDSILIQKGIDQVTGKIFCRLLGGGIEFGETSKQTIKREIREELGGTTLNEVLLCVVENIFEFSGKKGHEITFLYKGDLVEENLYKENKIKIIDKDDKDAEWVKISEIKSGNISLYPKEAVEYI